MHAAVCNVKKSVTRLTTMVLAGFAILPAILKQPATTYNLLIYNTIKIASQLFRLNMNTRVPATGIKQSGLFRPCRLGYITHCFSSLTSLSLSLPAGWQRESKGAFVCTQNTYPPASFFGQLFSKGGRTQY